MPHWIEAYQQEMPFMPHRNEAYQLKKPFMPHPYETGVRNTSVVVPYVGCGADPP